jgi:23S rRNA G2069 N7-methylase RlmK/C1962 C5-methylase RlmI
VAKENESKYELRAGSVGQLLNQRLHRNWVFKNSANKSVLNLYCSNGGYALSAALGEAKEVTAVDLSKQALGWARKNLELNKIEESRMKFLCRDSLSFLEQCQNKNIKFDLIICDAPSFYKRESGNFKLKANMEDLLAKAILSLNPNGCFLFSASLDELFIDDFRKAILKVQKALKIPKLELSCILPAMDFELPDTKANLKSFLIQL